MTYKLHCQSCQYEAASPRYVATCPQCGAGKVSEYVAHYGVTYIDFGTVATLCSHDALYGADNVAAGGAGCPICNAERQAQRTERPPFVPGCSLGVCSDCIPYDGCIPVAGDERVSSYEENRDAAF